MLLLIQCFVYPIVFTPGFVAQSSVSFLVYLLSRGPSVLLTEFSLVQIMCVVGFLACLWLDAKIWICQAYHLKSSECIFCDFRKIVLNYIFIITNHCLTSVNNKGDIIHKHYKQHEPSR